MELQFRVGLDNLGDDFIFPIIIGYTRKKRSSKWNLQVSESVISNPDEIATDKNLSLANVHTPSLTVAISYRVFP
jgi:hypothetical protein